MVTVRQGMAELAKALVVLALLFLSFGHKPIEPRYVLGSDRAIITLADGTMPILCGQVPDGDQGDHSPCHACKIFAGIDFTPAPCAVEPAFLAVAFVDYALFTQGIVRPAPTPPTGARAPPTA